MPCLTTSLYEGGYRKCDVNYHLNRVMEELKPVLCTWTGAQGMNRHLAMPHLNTYYRYREIQRSDGESRRPGGRVHPGGRVFLSWSWRFFFYRIVLAVSMSHRSVCVSCLSKERQA